MSNKNSLKRFKWLIKVQLLILGHLYVAQQKHLTLSSFFLIYKKHFKKHKIK